MAYTIDHSYRKDTTLPLGTGYSLRPGGIKPTAILIHTTNSQHQNTAFESEATYLQRSPNVSAHYLVGKQGHIAQILHPDLSAWHAGVAQAAYTNSHSIGIENHVSVGESWTSAQHDALTWLVRWLLRVYTIAPQQVETHRKVALPAGRKSDPESWPDASFYAWRGTLADPPVLPALPPKRYRVKHRYVTQRMEDNGPPLVRELLPGEEVTVDKWYSNGRVHFANGEGFADLADLEAI